MTNIDLLTIISALFTTIPIGYFLINRLSLVNYSKSIFVYLLFSFFVEVAFIINFFYLKSSTYYITLIFLLYEIFFLYNLNKKYFNKFFKKLLVPLLVIFGSLVFVELLKLGKVNYEIFLGGNKIIILIITLNLLLISFASGLPLWYRITIFAFLQYAFLGVVIFSFVSFFIENKEYIYYFVILNSLSNILLYLIITYSMYICKKKYLQV